MVEAFGDGGTHTHRPKIIAKPFITCSNPDLGMKPMTGTVRSNGGLSRLLGIFSLFDHYIFSIVVLLAAARLRRKFAARISSAASGPIFVKDRENDSHQFRAACARLPREPRRPLTRSVFQMIWKCTSDKGLSRLQCRIA